MAGGETHLLRVGEDEGCLVRRRVRRVRASRQHREERERDDARGGTPNAARRSGSSRGDSTRRDHARRGVCSASCALDDGRSRGSTRPRPPSRCQKPRDFLKKAKKSNRKLKTPTERLRNLQQLSKISPVSQKLRELGSKRNFTSRPRIFSSGILKNLKNNRKFLLGKPNFPSK